MTVVKLLQIGIGGMGNAWLNACRGNPEVTSAGWVEINPTIAEAQAAKYGLDRDRIYPSLDEALRAVRPDGVIIVTPPQTHRDLSIAALRAGLPVLSEKPLADTPEAAQDIVRAARETGMLHMVAQNYRYSRPAQTIQQVLRAGTLGAVGGVTVRFFRGPHFGGFREEMPYPLITDMAIHHFDMLRFFLEADPLDVQGRSWNPPWSWYRGDAAAALTLRLPGDVVASYTASWCAQGGDMPWNGEWRFDCAEGILELEHDRVWTQRPGEERQEAPLVELPATGQAYLLREFCTAISGGPTPATTCFDNIKSLGIVFAAIRAFEHGGAVQLGEA